MKAKKTVIIIAIILIAALAVYAALKIAKLPSVNTVPAETQQEETQEAAKTETEEDTQQSESADADTAPAQGSADMLTDTSYRGTVTAVSDDEITILLDGKDSYTFKLNKKAGGDVKYFGIAADSRVIVTFERSEDGTMTATSVDVVTSE